MGAMRAERDQRGPNRRAEVRAPSASSAHHVVALQRQAGNAAVAALVVQRHAAPGLRNTLGAGGLSDVILTLEDGTQKIGSLSFQSGRTELTEQVNVQRHAAPGLRNVLGAGGLSNVIFTLTDGTQLVGSLSFQSGRTNSLTEQGGTPPGPNRTGPATTTGSLLRLRVGPSLRSTVLGLLGERGTPITVLAQTTGDSVSGNPLWDEVVDSAGRRGFVSDHFVAFAER